jgi:AraC-like DNA-binding protein
MANGEQRSSDWLSTLRSTYALHNVKSTRRELPFWVIRWDGARGLDWMDLSDPSRQLKPFHFEIYFGKESVRDEHYVRALTRARRERRMVLAELFGFWDLFIPFAADPDGLTFLHAGQFLRAPLDWESLSTHWRALTGREPASANPDFVRFVRMAMSLPVLENPLIDALEEFGELYTEYLAGGGSNPDLQERIDELNRERISKLWPIEDWIESALSPVKFHLTPWYHAGKLMDWMKEGMGINRLPTTAMALMPMDSRAESLDPVQTLIRNAEIQRACIAFARSMPETAATHLQDYGISIITSTKSGKSAARARLELRERAQRFQNHLAERFRVRSVVGIGSTMSPGSPLHASHREAVLALHMSVQLEKDVLFFDEHPGGEPLRYGELQKAASALMDAFNRENNTESKLASDRYVRLVLIYSDERIEVVRSQFLATLFQLFSAIEKRHPMSAEARESFATDLTARLETVHSVYQVIEAFKEALQRLSFVSSAALQGPKVMRLEATLQYLRENFDEPLRLPDVAKKAGFSVPAYSRVFKQATGTSFLAYLRTIRVDHAKKLLTTTPMTTEQIAQACGFQSQHHLIRSFKKVTNQTPGAYRKAQAKRHAND